MKFRFKQITLRGSVLDIGTGEPENAPRSRAFCGTRFSFSIGPGRARVDVERGA